MEENFIPDAFTLQVDSGNTSYLLEAAKWAKFLAIVGFITCALLLIMAFFFGSLFSSAAELNSEFQGYGNLSNIIIIVYAVVIVALYFFPLLYLFNFGSKLQTAVRHNDQISLNTSFRNLKSCLKFLGILTIIILCVYAIGITFAMLGSAFMH